MARDRLLLRFAPLAVALATCSFAGLAWAAGGDLVTGTSSTTSTTVDQSAIIALNDDLAGDGIAGTDSMVITFSRPLSGTFFPPVGTPVSFTNASSFSIDPAADYPNQWQGFLVVQPPSLNPTPLPYDVTFGNDALAADTFVPGTLGTTGITWTAGPIDHYDVSVGAGSTSASVGAAPASLLQATARDRFGNLATDTVGRTLTLSGLLQDGTPSIGAFTPATVSLPLGTSMTSTFGVACNTVQVFGGSPEAPVTIRVTDGGGKLGNSDKALSWTRSPVTYTVASVPATLVASGQVTAFSMTNLTTASGMATSDTIVATFPGDWNLTGATSPVASHPVGFSDGVINVAARTVTWTRTGAFVAPGNLGAFIVDGVGTTRCTTFTQGQAVSVVTTRDATASTTLTISGFGAQGLKAPPPPAGAAANANTRVLLNVVNPDAAREVFLVSEPTVHYTFRFQTTTALPANGTLVINFDPGGANASNFGLSAVRFAGWAGIDGGVKVTIDDAGQRVFLVRDGTGTTLPGGRTFEVRLEDLTNPATASTSAGANLYSIALNTRDAPFTGSEAANVLDSSGTNSVAGLDYRRLLITDIFFSGTLPTGFPNLAKGSTVTFEIRDLDLYRMDTGQKFRVVAPPWGPEFSHIGGGFTMADPGSFQDLPDGLNVALFGSSTTNALEWTASGNDDDAGDTLTFTITLPNYPMEGVRFFIFHNSTDTNGGSDRGNQRAFVMTAPFNVVDTGNLALNTPGGPARLTNDPGVRIASAPTNTELLYDLDFSHTVTVPSAGFVDVTTLAGDSHWSTNVPANGMQVRNLVLTGVRFGLNYRGTAGAGADDNPTTDSDSRLYVRLVRHPTDPALDVIELRNNTAGGGDLLAAGTMGTSNGLGYVTLVEQPGGKGVSGSVVVVARGTATGEATATPPPVTQPANFEPHSIRVENGRSVFRWKNMGGDSAGSAKRFIIGDSASDLVTVTTLPSAGTATVQLVGTNGTTVLEGPSSTPMAATGQTIEGPGAGNAPTMVLTETRTYETVTTTTLRFATHSQVPVGGTVVLTLPPEFAVTDGPLTGTWRTNPRLDNGGAVYADPVATGSTPTADFAGNAAGKTLVVTNSGTVPIEAGYHAITVTSGLRNPPLPGSYVANLRTAGGGPIDPAGPAGATATAVAAVSIDGHTGASGDPIVVNSVTPTVTTTGTQTTYTVAFANESDIPADGRVVLQFFDPTGTMDLTGIAAASGGNTNWATSNVSQVVGNFSIVKDAAGTANPTVTITRSGGGSVLTPGTMTLTFTGAIKNPRLGNRSFPVQVTTQTSVPATIDQSDATSATFATSGGAVSGLTLVSTSSTLAGAAGASYRVQFTTQSFLPRTNGATGGQIVITFPSNTDTSAAGLTVTTAPAGGFTPTLSGAGNVLTITHGAATDVVNGAWDLTITGVRNATQAQAFMGATGLRVETRDDAASSYAALDAQATADVTLTGGDLTSVAMTSPVSPVGAPRPAVTAGATSDTYRFDFRLNADVSTSNAIEVTFPLGFNVSGVSTTPGTHVVLEVDADGAGAYTTIATYAISLLPDNLTVRLTPTSTIDAATTPFVRLSISNVKNTTVVNTHQFTAIRTLNTANGVTIDPWPAAALARLDVDGAGFAAGSVTYGVAPAAADQETSTHTFTFQMGSTLPRDGIVTITFEDREVKLATSLAGPNPGPASAFTGTSTDAITWAGIDGGYSIRAIQHATTAAVSSSGLVLERNAASGGDTSPVRHAIQFVDVVTNTSVLGGTRYRIDAFRNPATAMRPRLRADGASGRVTFVSTTLLPGQVFTSTDLTGAIHLEVTGASGSRTITAYRDLGRGAGAQVGQVTLVADTATGVPIACTDPVLGTTFDVVVDVNGLLGGERDVVETLWRIDPPVVTFGGGEDLSGAATIVESSAQNVSDVVSPPAKGAAATHTISFSTPVVVRGAPTSHVIRVKLGKQAGQTSPFSFANVVANPGANFDWKVNGGPSVASFTLQTDPAPDASILWITYTGAADLPAGDHVLTLRQVLNSNDEGTDFFAQVSMYRRVDAAPTPDVLADRVITETSSPNFSLSGAQLTNVTATPSEARATEPSAYTIRFESLTQVPADGQVRIVFPKDALEQLQAFGLTTLGGEVLSSLGSVGVWRLDLDKNGAYETNLDGAKVELDAGDATLSTLVLSRTDALGILGDGVNTVRHEIVFNQSSPTSSVVNIDTKGSYTLAISTHSRNADDAPGPIIEGPNDSSPPFNIVGDVVTVTGVSLSPSASAAALAQHTVTFTTSTRLPKDAKLVFTYDAGADTWASPSPGFDAVASTPADLNLINFSFSAGVLAAQRNGLGATIAPGTYTVVLTGFTNSTNRHREHRVTLETRDALNVPIDAAAAVANSFPPRFIVQPGQLGAVQVTPSPTTASNTAATHAIDFTTTSAIPRDGRIFVRYADAGFGLANVLTGEVSLTGVSDSTKLQVETATADGRIVIKLDGTLPSALAPATRTLTIQDIDNTSNAATTHTLEVVLLSGGATVPVGPEAFPGVGAGGTYDLAPVNGRPPVVVPGSVALSTGDVFVVDEIAGRLTFPNGTAGGTVSYRRYPEVVAAGIGSPVPVDLAATSAAFTITGGAATRIRFDGVTVGSVRNREAWPNTYSFQLLDGASNPTTNTGGNPIVISFASAETAAGATLQWSGGVASIPTSAIQPDGTVVLDLMSFQGRLTGTESPGFNKGHIDLAATVGTTTLTLVGVGGVDNRVKVIPGDFVQVAWPDQVAQQTVDKRFTGSVVLQALDADGNRPPTPTTTPDLRILPRAGATTSVADETPKGALFNLSGSGDVVLGTSLDAGTGTFDLVANGAKYIGPTGLTSFHVHRVSDGTHVTIIDTFDSGATDPATFLPRDPLQVTFVAGQAARVNWTLASAFGRRVSGLTPSTSILASTYQFTVAMNGDSPAPTATMVIGANITSDGQAVAAALQSAIRNMTASSAALQRAYSQARVAFTGGQYVVVSGLDATAGASSVGSFADVTGTAMDALKLTDARGATGTAGDPAAVYRVDALFPSGAAFELQDAGGNPTQEVGAGNFIRLRLASTKNPGFELPRLSYEAPTSATLPDVMTEATPDVDFVDLLPPGTTTNLGNVVRYGGGNNNGLPMRLSVLVGREDTNNSPRTVQSTAGTPLAVTATVATWTADDLVGKTVLFTSGPAFGRRALIASNTVDTLIIVEPLAPAVRTLTGTVTVTLGSAAVTGAGTLFTSELLPGHRIELSSEPGVFYAVAAITDDTNLTLTAPVAANGASVAVTRGGPPAAADTFEIVTTTELPVVSSQVDGVDNTVVLTPAKAARCTLQGLTGTFDVNVANPGSLLAQDRYGNVTNDVGSGAVFGLSSSPPAVGAPFSASNIVTNLPDGGGATVAGARFTSGVAAISPIYLGAALADGSQLITISITVDGTPVTVVNATYNVDAGSPRHVQWIGLEGATLHAGRPLNDSASPTGLGPAGAGPFELRLYDASGNAVEAADVPAVSPSGIRVTVVNDGTFPKLDTALADTSQPDSVTFGSGDTLQSGSFAGNVATIAPMRFNGRASQVAGHQLAATLVEPGNITTPLVPVTFLPAANPAANPTFTVKPGALAHFHWVLSNTLVQQPSQPLDAAGTYEVHAHDAAHNRLGAAGEEFEARPTTPLSGAGYDLVANAGTTPELVYLFPQNASDASCRLGFGATDPGTPAPLLGRVRLDKTSAAPAPAWTDGVYRLGPSPDADLRYFGLNGDVQVNIDVTRVTPGRHIGLLTGDVSVDLLNAQRVVGTGTLFTTEVRVGERLELALEPGVYYEVASITNDLELLLTAPFAGLAGTTTKATPYLPVLANVTNASNAAPPTATDFIRVGAGAVDHFWFKDATATERWDVTQTNAETWNAASAGSQIVARDIAGNSINTYTTDGQDVRLITYEHHRQGTASAYDATTFTLTFSSAPSASATPDNVIIVNARTGAVAKVVGISGSSIRLESPGFRFGDGADNSLVLNTDTLDLLVRLNAGAWRFRIGDSNVGTTRDGGLSNDQPQILKTQFDFSGGTFSINDTQGVPGAEGWKWTGRIPSAGRIVVRPVINIGAGQFEHRGLRGGAASPIVPAGGGLEVPINPGTVTGFVWSTAPGQLNATPFAGTNTLTAVDVSGNVNIAFNGTTDLTVGVAPTSRIPAVGTAFVTGLGASPSTQFTTTEPSVSAAIVGRTVHLFDNAGALKAEAVVVAYDPGTQTVTTTSISPQQYVAAGAPDQFVIDPFPPGSPPTLTPAQLSGTNWTLGVANLSGAGVGLTYQGVANGVQVTLTATSGSVQATSSPIVMTPGPGTKLAVLYRGTGLGLPDELLVEGTPNSAGGDPTIVQKITTPALSPNQSLFGALVVLDQNNNRVTSPGASTGSILNTDPFGTQGPRNAAWDGSGRLQFSVQGRTVNGLVAPPATRTTPATWSVSASSTGGFTAPAGVADRTFLVQTDGVKRVEYLFDHPDQAAGTFSVAAGDVGTATTLQVGTGTPFTSAMVGMVLVNTTNVGAYGKVTAATSNRLTFNALQGADPTRSASWSDGDAWRVVPMYHIDGMLSSTVASPGVEGSASVFVLTAGASSSGRVLLLDSGNNITANIPGDQVAVGTTDPFDAQPSGNFGNGVYSFTLVPRQAAHNTGVPPATKDETDTFTILSHSLSINATGPSIDGLASQEGASSYQIVPGPAAGVVLLVSTPTQKLRRGDAASPLSGTPPLQTAGSAFLIRAYVVDADNNPVNYDGTITLGLPFGTTAGPFAVTEGDTGNGSFVTINRSGFALRATPDDPAPTLGAPALRATDPFDVKPGAPSHAIVYVSAATSPGGGTEALANGQSAAGDPPGSLSLTGGTLTQTAGLDNLTVTATVTDALSNPVLLFDLTGAGDKRARVVTTDPNNPFVDYDYTTSSSFFVPTYSYAGFPLAGTNMQVATLARTMTITRAQLQQFLDVDLASLADDVAVALTPHRSRAIRVNAGPASRAVIVLPGQTLNTGARLGQPVFIGAPDEQIEGVEFPIRVFAADAFYNVQFADSTSTVDTLRTDEGIDYVGGLGFRLSAEGAATLVNNGQLEFADLNGLAPQIPFASASTGPDVAEEMEQAVREQTIAVSDATTKFNAYHLPEFARYLLVSGQATKPLTPISRVLMGANTTDGLLLEGTSSGADGVLSPGAATFTTGVLAFTMRHNVAGDIHFLEGTATVGGGVAIRSENYRVLKPDFAVASVTMLDDGAGKIDRARIVFTLSADPSSIAGVAKQFELTHSVGGKAATLLGSSVSVLSTTALNDTVDVFFSGKVSTTSVAGFTLTYTRPQSGGLRADKDLGGKLLDTTTRTNLAGLAEIRDGAVPALVNVTNDDRDGDGGLDLLRFVFSEDVDLAAGAGFSKSGFDAGDVTTALAADDAFVLALDGEAAQAIVLGDLQTGASVADAIQATVRGMIAADPLRQRAYDNFTASFDARNGRYLLRSGVGLRYDLGLGRHVLDWPGSSVVVTAQPGNTGATNLKLGAADGGVERGGFGDAQPGMSVSTVAPLMEVTAGSIDQLRIQIDGDAPRVVSLSITVDQVGTPALDDRGRAIADRLQDVVRQLVSQSPSLQPAYDGFTATWDPTQDQLVLASGTSGPTSAVVVSATGTPQDAAASLGLGSASGGTERAGGALSPSLRRLLDDLVVLSQDGLLNLLVGRTDADVTVSGNRIDVQLADVPGTATAMPRFALGDAGDGGFIQDLAGAPRSLPESTNVADLDGRFAQVLDLDGVADDVLEVAPGDIALDATRSLPPLTAAGGTVVYRWEQVGAPSLGGTDPADLTIDNRDGNPPGTSTADTSARTAEILGATTPGVYTLRLVATVVDAAGNPLPNAFTDGAGQVVREFRVLIADQAPIAIIGTPDPLVANGPVSLDGNPSIDPNGDALNYLWTAEQVNGTPVAGAFSDDTIVDPVFTAPGNGVFRITLYVATAPGLPVAGASPSDSIFVSSGATVPYAAPGPDLTGRVRVPVVMDAGLSLPVGTVTFDWQVLSTPAPVQLSTSGTTAQFTPTSPGLYLFRLVVNDGTIDSAPRDIMVMVVDDLAPAPRFPPVARPRIVGLRRATFLATPPLTDPTALVLDDGQELALEAYVATGDPAPTARGLTTVEVIDGGAVIATAYARLPSGRDISALRLPDGTLADVLAYAREGDGLTLDGSQSQSASSVVATYTWRQQFGPFLFTSRTGGIIGFSPQQGYYELTLVVEDSAGLASRPVVLKLHVLPPSSAGEGPPTAVAEGPASVAQGQTVALDAIESVSRAATAGLQYRWDQVSGPPCVLNGATTDNASVDADLPGVYTFRVTVTDANLVSDRAEVSFAVDGPTFEVPVASIAPAQDVILSPGQAQVEVTLQASATPAPTGGSVRFLWTQLDGSPVFVDTIAGTATSPRLRLRMPGRYTFAVTAVAVDSTGVIETASAPATATLVVSGGQDVPLVNGGTRSESSGGCAMSHAPPDPSSPLPLLALAALLIVLRRAIGRTAQ